MTKSLTKLKHLVKTIVKLLVSDIFKIQLNYK